MIEKYCYNKRTHCLHIIGYCKDSKAISPDAILFESEDEALAFDGRAVRMCKNCMKKRDSKLKK